MTPPGCLLRETHVPPDLAQLKEVRRLVDNVAHEALLDDDRIYDLKVAVSEACANAIEHPHKKEEVVLRAWVDRERLHVEVRHGGEFRLGRQDGRGERHRGLGLPLMVALVDEVKISRPEGNGTTVQLSLVLS